MIIQIAGTSGSGKTTAMRKVLQAMKKLEPVKDGRKYPFAYVGSIPGVPKDVWVLGPYEPGLASSGCDALDTQEVLPLVEECARGGDHVLFEGLYQMNQTRGPALAAEWERQFAVILLDTPLGVCLQGITDRREVATTKRHATPKDTSSNHKRAIKYASRMYDAGARRIEANRDEVPELILKLLKEDA